MTDTATTATTATSSAQNASMMVVLLFVTLIAIVMAVGAIITFWKLFTKAGKPGWASIVPVYNLMVMGQIGGLAPWVGITAGVLSLVTSFVPFLGLVVLGFEIYLLVGMMKKYDAGGGFWVAAILLPIVSAFLVKNVNYKGGDTPGTAAPQPGNMTPPSTPQPPVSQPPTSDPPASQPPAA